MLSGYSKDNLNKRSLSLILKIWLKYRQIENEQPSVMATLYAEEYAGAAGIWVERQEAYG